MIEAVKNDMATRFKEAADKHNLYIDLAYSGNPEEAESWREEAQTAFPDYELSLHPLSLSVACHIGHGALAITCTEGLNI